MNSRGRTAEPLPKRAKPGQSPSSRVRFTDLVLTATLVTSMVGMAVALGALLFSGPLVDGRAQATAGFIVGAGLAAAWLALRSHLVPLAVLAQDAPAVVLVAVVAAVIDRDPSVDPTTVIALLATSTLVAGLLMVGLGWARLGEAVRYLPTVVVQGFIAGTGWLLFRGGVEVAVDRSLALEDIGTLTEWGMAQRWLPALVLALAVWACGMSARVPIWAGGSVVLAATMVFYLVAAAVSSPARVEDDGWLIGPFDSGARPSLVDPTDLADLPWAGLGVGSLLNFLTLLLVTVLAMLLNLSALERIRRTRIDTSHELRQTGVANAAVAVVGAIPTFHALGDTVLAERLGVRGRAVPIGAGLLTALLGVVGASLVGYVPLMVAGGLLMAVGISLLIDWVRFLATEARWVERTLSASVVGVIMVIGIIEGVLVGLVLASAVFVFRYSRVDSVRRLTDGSVSRSRIDRTPEQIAVLDAHKRGNHRSGAPGLLLFRVGHQARRQGPHPRR